MKTVFNYNTPVTAEWFNVVNGFRLRFDGDPLLPGDMVDGQYLPIRLQDLDPAILQPYVQSLDVVKTTGDQNINGKKTFLDPVEVASATANSHAITKAQLDTAIATLAAATTALNAAVVKLTTAQTIAGVKTFSVSPQIPPGSTPGAAVNYAQLSALTPIGLQPNTIKIGDKQIVYGSTFITSGWSGNPVAFDILLNSLAPGFTIFTSPPTISVVTNRLLAIQAESYLDRITGNLREVGTPQPNNCFLHWIAIGSI
jgi:Lower baseplate protein N-terminal domain